MNRTIADPCCGSGGFSLAAQFFLADPENYSLDREQKEFFKNGTFWGNELVPSTFKLCLMNLYLHNIGDIYGNLPVTLGDALLTDPGRRVEYVLTNPLWVYDFRTNVHFTLKQHPLTNDDLDDFVRSYNPSNRYDRKETWSEDNPDGRFRRFDVKQFFERDKTSMDFFWIKDKSLADLDNLPDPDVLASEIIDNLQSAFDSFKELGEHLKG
ncbi:MAG: N-6 DNA methylase [Sphaerochaetaceae bacterium]|nr:SAM-dependent methyltransferase [Sphaerochaetaceae bacterium]